MRSNGFANILIGIIAALVILGGEFFYKIKKPVLGITGKPLV